MTGRTPGSAIVLLATLSAALHTQQPARTIKDGVYTEEQAGRGRSLYQEHCASCHGPELAGIEMAAPLAGSLFQGDWTGATLGELFERIRVSMPKDKPGTLSRQQIADVVAFILSFNKIKAGPSELPQVLPALEAIKIEF